MWAIFSLVATTAQWGLDQAALLSPMMVSRSLGCCWILMGLLFIGGVMNLLWIAAIATFVLLEKTLPFGVVGERAAGAPMILIGALSFAV
jgi:predicted metal-binding membrane protein